MRGVNWSFSSPVGRHGSLTQARMSRYTIRLWKRKCHYPITQHVIFCFAPYHHAPRSLSANWWRFQIPLEWICLLARLPPNFNSWFSVIKPSKLSLQTLNFRLLQPKSFSTSLFKTNLSALIHPTYFLFYADKHDLSRGIRWHQTSHLKPSQKLRPSNLSIS